MHNSSNLLKERLHTTSATLSELWYHSRNPMEDNIPHFSIFMANNLTFRSSLSLTINYCERLIMNDSTSSLPLSSVCVYYQFWKGGGGKYQPKKQGWVYASDTCTYIYPSRKTCFDRESLPTFTGLWKYESYSMFAK